MPKKENKKATVYVWTGTGAGKTTSSLGVALRQVGHEQNVVVIQFMKGRKDIGEVLVQKKLAQYYEIHQFGREGWINYDNPSKEDIKMAEKGLEFARSVIKRKKLPNLLILDEINLAATIGLLKEDDVLKFLDEVPEEVVIYATGRFASYKMMKRADYVTEFVTLKCPEKMTARKGIEW